MLSLPFLGLFSHAFSCSTHTEIKGHLRVFLTSRPKVTSLLLEVNPGTGVTSLSNACLIHGSATTDEGNILLFFPFPPASAPGGPGSFVVPGICLFPPFSVVVVHFYGGVLP